MKQKRLASHSQSLQINSHRERERETQVWLLQVDSEVAAKFESYFWIFVAVDRTQNLKKNQRRYASHFEMVEL